MVFQVEDAPGIVQERLRKILGSMPVPRGLLLYTRKEPLRFAGAHGKPYEPAFARLQATLKKHAPVDIAILDPLVYLHEAEENSSSEMARWLVPLRDTCRAAGTAPFIVHHAGWVPDGEDARSRGTTAIRAWSDLELGLRAQTKNGRSLHRLNLVKTNFAPRWKKPLSLALNEATLRFEPVDEAEVLCAPDELAAWLRDEHGGTWPGKRSDLYEAICRYFGCEERTAREAVKRAKDERLIIDQGQRTPLTCAGMWQTGLL
jgi:RecA-family ATPase